MTSLETDRLRLRPLTQDDLPDVHRIGPPVGWRRRWAYEWKNPPLTRELRFSSIPSKPANWETLSHVQEHKEAQAADGPAD